MQENMTATFVIGTRQIAQGYSAVEVQTCVPSELPVTVHAGARYILLGGGIGIAAIAGIARKLASCGISFELHNFARTPERAVFRDELDRVQVHGKVHHHFGLSAEDIAREVAHALGPTHANSQVYCSGPPTFMDFIRQRALEWVYKENVHQIFLGDRSRMP